MNNYNSRPERPEKLFFDYAVDFRYSTFLLIVIFWSYGLYGAGSHPSFGTLANALITIYIILITIIINQTFKTKILQIKLKQTS